MVLNYKILLISTYELGHQPLGLASPAAHLLEEGLTVECIDLSVEPFNMEKVGEADFIGISIPMHTAMRLGIKVAERIREIKSECHICFYGLYASLNGEFLLSRIGDSIIGGEFEEPLRKLVRFLVGRPVDDLSGVWTQTHRSSPFLGRQSFLPPARSLLPALEEYARLKIGNQTMIVGAVEASRGCAHKCLHCPITPVYKGRMRIVQEEVVQTDIQNLMGMGAQHITFSDPDFLNGVEHSLGIVHQMHDRFPELTFDITAKIEHIIQYPELITDLKKQGCVFIQSALESLSDPILNVLEKGHTRADVLKALEITRGAGVTLRPSFVALTPWTTLDDYLEVLEFVESQRLIYHVEPIQYAIRLLLPPGSSLLDSPHLIPWLGELDAERFSYDWRHSDLRMEQVGGEVSKIVEEASINQEDEMETFYRIKGLVYSALKKKPLPSASFEIVPEKDRPPRLTESWFCCAEPSSEQLRPIRSKAQELPC